MYRVFVYGSLLSGEPNHGLLRTARFIGTTRSPKKFAMLDLGYFPGVIPTEDEEHSVLGEVYEVDDETLRNLDRLEGYRKEDPSSGLYDRVEIDTEFGKAMIYVYNNRYKSRRFVENGDWKRHFINKTLS